MLIVADGMIAYAERCADLAPRPPRRPRADPRARPSSGRWRASAGRCLGCPPTGWWEALQSLHFCRMGTALAEGGGSHCVGRFDQYVSRSCSAISTIGRDLPRAKAQELLECLFVKWNEVRVYSPGRGGGIQGMRQNDKLTIGGVDRGRARRRRTSSRYMCLEAHAHVHLNDPNISRAPPPRHAGRSPAALAGGGSPGRRPAAVHQRRGDHSLADGATAGCRSTDARNYADVGCQENVSDPNVSPGPRHATATRTPAGSTSSKPVELRTARRRRTR